MVVVFVLMQLGAVRLGMMLCNMVPPLPVVRIVGAVVMMKAECERLARKH